MKDNNHTVVWLLYKHFQRSFDELAFGLHAVHAVTEQHNVEFFVSIACTIGTVGPDSNAAVQKQWDSAYVRPAFKTGHWALRLQGGAK
jgi:hypothetical protein